MSCPFDGAILAEGAPLQLLIKWQSVNFPTTVPARSIISAGGADTPPYPSAADTSGLDWSSRTSTAIALMTQANRADSRSGTPMSTSR